MLRNNAKRDAELLKRARDDTAGISDAHAAIITDVGHLTEAGARPDPAGALRQNGTRTLPAA